MCHLRFTIYQEQREALLDVVRRARLEDVISRMPDGLQVSAAAVVDLSVCVHTPCLHVAREKLSSAYINSKVHTEVEYYSSYFTLLFLSAK